MPSVHHSCRRFPTQCTVTDLARPSQKHRTIWYLVLSLIYCSLLMPVSSFAWTYYLQQDLGVQGLVHLCRYSNGKAYTVNATELCPLSIEDSAPGFGQGQGFLQGEYRDGMTKVCVYDVLGEKRAIRLPSTALCPLNSTF